MPPVPALKPPVQIAYLGKMGGLSLMLVLGAGGTKAFRALTYRNGYPTISLKQAKAKARDYFKNPRKLEEQATIGTLQGDRRELGQAPRRGQRVAHRIRAETTSEDVCLSKMGRAQVPGYPPPRCQRPARPHCR
jgi:hypothetical protein